MDRGSYFFKRRKDKEKRERDGSFFLNRLSFLFILEGLFCFGKFIVGEL